MNIDVERFFMAHGTCIYEENKIRMLSKTELISVYDGTGENKSSDNVEGSGISVAPRPLGYTCE